MITREQIAKKIDQTEAFLIQQVEHSIDVASHIKDIKLANGYYYQV